jgi:hypothetical protein
MAGTRSLRWTRVIILEGLSKVWRRRHQASELTASLNLEFHATATIVLATS